MFIDDSLSGRSTSFSHPPVSPPLSYYPLLIPGNLVSISLFPPSLSPPSLSLPHHDRLMEVDEAEASKVGRMKLDMVFLGVIGR